MSALALQRKTPAPIAAPPIRDMGAPLDTSTRSVMESSFGRSFEQVRIHDDARAHDNARDLGARAYAAGNDIVFGEGQYRPGTPSGLALIGHELAHSVQQGGVQMKSAGPIPAAADRELETQADRAAEAALAGRQAPALSQIGNPAVFRAPLDEPAPAADSKAASPGPNDLPDGATIVEESPKGPGATYLIVSMPQLDLPAPKGAGNWVEKAYSDAVAGKSLIFSPVFNGKTIGAFKEKAGESYKDIWLNSYGFNSLKEVADSFKAAAASDTSIKAKIEEPSVNVILKGFETNKLPPAKCDIDHIVEKQIGGASIRSNLQLLLSEKNQKSGVDTFNMLKEQVGRIRSVRPNLKQLQIRYSGFTLKPDTPDASFEVETLLRSGKIKGSEEVKKKGEGEPVAIRAGGKTEITRVRGTGKTPVEDQARRIVPGLKLTDYARGAAKGKAKGQDTIEAELASKPLLPGPKTLTLQAILADTPGATGESGEAGAAGASKVTASEFRDLKLDAAKNKDLAFYYPYLSPGKFTKLDLDPGGNLSGEGAIHPSIKFLGELKVRFAKDTLDLVKDIDVEQMNKSAPMRSMAGFFRFTGGAFKLDLLKFQPSGTVNFTLGPKAKPYVEGDITAKAEGTTFVAEGNVKTAATLPGLKDGKGNITYRSDTGWSGSLTATSSTIRGATANVTMTFSEARDHFLITANGKISTQIRGAQLELGAEWKDGDLAFYGGVTVHKPLPLVESASLKGRYARGLLALTAKPKVHWKAGQVDLTGEAEINYYRKEDDDEGKFFGSVTFDVKNEKMDGKITVALSEAGKPSGKGELSYQLTKQLRPKLGIELEPTGKVKLSGELKVADIPLTDQWPKPPDDRKSIIKGSVAAHIPTPVPALSVTLKVTGELGVFYSVGPMALKGLMLTASLYPFEDDKQIAAKLTGAFVIPAKGGLYGRFGVLIGAEVGYGALGAEGGLYVVPEVGVHGEGGIKINADYSDEGFSFEGEAYAKGSMFGSLGIDFAVDVSALWGLVSHEWTIPVKKWGPKNLGPELTITLGKVGYSKEGKITWPSLSDIDVNPKEFDPMGILKDVLSDSVGS